MPEPTRSRPRMPAGYGVPTEEAGMLAWSLADKYGGYRPESYKGGAHVVAPRVAFAWNEFPKTPTRWTFGE